MGSLWSASGTLLAQATFTSETASGWQQVAFSTPVAVTAGNTYVVSYSDPNGHYSATPAASPPRPTARPSTRWPQPTRPTATVSTATRRPTTFPVNTYQATNYWVDPVYTQTIPVGPGGADGRHRDRRQRAAHRLVDRAVRGR